MSKDLWLEEQHVMLEKLKEDRLTKKKRKKERKKEIKWQQQSQNKRWGGCERK